MFGMKYIIVDDAFAVIFPAAIYHVDAFSLFSGYEYKGCVVTGAGYIGADEEGKLFVYGRSEGFDIDSKPEDIKLILTALHRDAPVRKKAA